MRTLLVLLMALMPSMVFADNSEPRVNEGAAPAVTAPCVKENGRSPIMDYELSAPYTRIASTKGVDSRDGYRHGSDPCVVERSIKPEGKEEHGTGDPWEDYPYLRLFPN